METSKYIKKKEQAFTSTRNACKQCSPLGSSLAFKGIKNCIPLIHGSQGCSTYIRRYMISHFREPIDIASSNFSENSTVFGGAQNFNISVDNLIKQYNPEVIAISSTCLSETIGEDVKKMISEYKAVNKGKILPELIFASTPSYAGSHVDGYHEAVFETIKSLSENKESNDIINLFPGILSPEDLRLLKEVFLYYNQSYIMFPDYSDTLDNPSWDEYKKISDGGTSVEALKRTGSSKASIEFGYVFNSSAQTSRIKTQVAYQTAAKYLNEKFEIPTYSTGFPIGIKESDAFFNLLNAITGKETPEKYLLERGRLVDSYIDGHKYLSGKKAFVYGDEDLIIGIISFLSEIGIKTVLCATGGESKILQSALENVLGDRFNSEMIIGSGMDFESMGAHMETYQPDIMIGSSKGVYLSKRHDIPLVRVGFPIHDRIGSQRVKHILYEGTQELFDKITNALLEKRQDDSEIGYQYM